MTINDTFEEDEDNEIRRFSKARIEPDKDISDMTARELAYYHKNGNEQQQILYRTFLNAQSEEYKTGFDEALKDPLLGERIDDDFEDAW
jgi:hypothetical protein